MDLYSLKIKTIKDDCEKFETETLRTHKSSFAIVKKLIYIYIYNSLNFPNKICFSRYIIIQILNNHNCFNSSINYQKQTFIFCLEYYDQV